MMDASKWEIFFYRKRGWTEDDFLLEFRKNPLFMNLSEMNFSSKIDFLMNEIAFQMWLEIQVFYLMV
ncbi:hypothetical protein PRUPE_3G045800 [Prunus persica]|uniref:Uncharacterized protein n=1 Tax=Prunus persica TaxID=3760 RepID=A0A251PV98_PRUPE|nr:hypothetical protein PRUPE_3G045800 [Prunus persica]